jgi:hypothetical protein
MAMDVNQFLAGLNVAEQRMLDAVVRGVDLAGEHVIGDSQTNAPVKRGDLKASGTTQPAKLNGLKVGKRLGHGVKYAAAVHELHKTKSKFLERALKTAAANGSVEKMVGIEVRKAMQ